MIVGVGVDVVDVERFKWMMRRSTTMIDRTFASGEARDAAGTSRSAESLAARFAAKEAVVKALGDRGLLRPNDVEVITRESGRPDISLSGELLAISEQLGITNWHVSLAHDGGQAIAYVIAESRSVT